jgi:hypothetical protein
MLRCGQKRRTRCSLHLARPSRNGRNIARSRFQQERAARSSRSFRALITAPLTLAGIKRYMVLWCEGALYNSMRDEDLSEGTK